MSPANAATSVEIPEYPTEPRTLVSVTTRPRSASSASSFDDASLVVEGPAYGD